MPVKNCTKNGKSGKKFGEKGTCYVGKDAEKKAKIQGRAIKSQKK